MGAKKRRAEVSVEMGRLADDAVQHSTSSTFWLSPDDPYCLSSDTEDDTSKKPMPPATAKSHRVSGQSQGSPDHLSKARQTRVSPRLRKQIVQSKATDTNGSKGSPERPAATLPEQGSQSGKEGMPGLIIPESPSPVLQLRRPNPVRKSPRFTARVQQEGEAPPKQSQVQGEHLASTKQLQDETKCMEPSATSSVSQNTEAYNASRTGSVPVDCVAAAQNCPQKQASKAQASKPQTGDVRQASNVATNISTTLGPTGRPLKQSRLAFLRQSVNQPPQAPLSQPSQAAAPITHPAPTAKQPTCTPAISQALDEIEAGQPSSTSAKTSRQDKDGKPKQQGVDRVNPGTLTRIARQSNPRQRGMSRLNPDAATAKITQATERTQISGPQAALQVNRPEVGTDSKSNPGAMASAPHAKSRLAQDSTAPHGEVLIQYSRRPLQPEKEIKEEGGAKLAGTHLAKSEAVAGKSLPDKLTRNVQKSGKVEELRARSQSAGLRTPLLLRHGFHNSLSRALSGTSFHSPAPATTVVQAQESGEQRLVQDNMLYALDGLCTSSSSATHCQAAGSLLDIALTKRGRQALRCDGVLCEAMATGKGILSKSWNNELGLIFAAIVHFFLADASHLGALACREGIELITCLVSPREQLQPATEESRPVHPVVKRLVTELQNSKALPAGFAEAMLPAAICLISVVGAIDAQQTSPASESLKTAIREQGALLKIADMVAQMCKQPADAWDLFHLRVCLLCLENCTFACPANESFLVKLRIQDGSTAVSLVSRLVQLMQQLATRKNDPEGSAQCLHSALSLAINLTHHNDLGCQQVVNAGGAQLAIELMETYSRSQNKLGNAEGALQHEDMVTVAMGLLINLADNCIHSLQPLTKPSSSGGLRLLHLLCSIFDACGREEETGEQEIHSSPDAEVTVEELSSDEDSGARSIIQAYAALLIGFLVVADQQLWAEAEQDLADQSLQLVSSKIKYFLDFHIAAGAIPKKSEDSLQKLHRAMTGRLGGEK